MSSAALTTTPIEGAIAARREFTEDEIQLIKDTVATDATDAELKLFLHQANAKGLDPLNREIHFQKRRWQKNGQWQSRVTIITGIDGYRKIAERTGKYEGQAGPFWCGDDGEWKDVWLDPNHPPVAAKVGVYRKGFRNVLWAVARFDAYAATTYDQKTRAQRLNSMWAKMGDLMIAKCAEALALRKAFPDDLAGVYTAEEMQQAEDAIEVDFAPADPSASRSSSNGSGKAESSASTASKTSDDGAPRVLKETPENPTVDDYLARIRGLESPPECEAWEKKHLGYINENFDEDEIKTIADAYYERKEELQQEWDAAASEPPDLNLWGNILKTYRQEHELDPAGLAKEIGVRESTLRKIFAGQKVSAGTLKKVSDFVVAVSAP